MDEAVTGQILDTVGAVSPREGIGVKAFAALQKIVATTARESVVARVANDDVRKLIARPIDRGGSEEGEVLNVGT